MEHLEDIWNKLTENGFKISTDTRGDVSRSVFFGIKGENFDGSTYGQEALEKGAVLAVTDNALEILQKLARRYRDTFDIPVVAIGGSNGKTTTRELTRCVLETKYHTYTTKENLNNHLGVPLSIFALDKSAEIAVFEIGANHQGEHLELLEILHPTHVLVTNNGLDHLEGFGSPEGVELANKEIIDWAEEQGKVVIHKMPINLEKTSSLPLTLRYEDSEYKTQLFGDYNLENIISALSIGQEFGLDTKESLEAITHYSPTLKRSQLVEKDGTKIILDCYNANPTSLRLALESFISSAVPPRAVVLGDMLELGDYSDHYHREILEYLAKQNIERTILVGENFKKTLEYVTLKSLWFESSEKAREWFTEEDWKDWTVLVKGSRGMRLEKVVE